MKMMIVPISSTTSKN